MTNYILATIRYTADLIKYDGSDTNCYGEPCELGTGYTLEWGWWNPDYDVFAVFEGQQDGAVDRILSNDMAADDMTLEEMIETVIIDRIGGLGDYDGKTAYASDPIKDYTTNADVRPAAHVTRHYTPETIAVLENNLFNEGLPQ